MGSSMPSATYKLHARENYFHCVCVRNQGNAANVKLQPRDACMWQQPESRSVCVLVDLFIFHAYLAAQAPHHNFFLSKTAFPTPTLLHKPDTSTLLLILCALLLVPPLPLPPLLLFSGYTSSSSWPMTITHLRPLCIDGVCVLLRP